MSEPFFTIAIPTKNRSERLARSIQSVVGQTFTNLELIVCDNSDDPLAAEANEALIRRLHDPRVRYLRTGGQLSMPDNWERSIVDAQGRFVGILTDRSVFRRNALQVVHAEIESSGATCVSWFSDLYGRDADGRVLQRRGVTFKRHRLESETILRYFLNGHPKYATKIVPKLMTCVCDRTILETIRQSIGRCCLPVAPDFTSGFLILAHSKSVLVLDEAMYVSCGTGNGAAFRMRGELAESFRRDLGLTWSEMVDEMPTSACFAHALVLNDFMRVRGLVPDRFQGLELNHFQYYAGCLNDYLKTARHGVRRDEDMDTLLAGLAQEPVETQAEVRATKLYEQLVAFRGSAGQSISVGAPPAKKNDGAMQFESVLDAIAWDEANPREPAAQSFLETLPGAAELKRIRPLSDQAERRPRLWHRVRALVRDRSPLWRRLRRARGRMRTQAAKTYRASRALTQRSLRRGSS